MRRPRGPGGRFLTAEEIAARDAGIDPNSNNQPAYPDSRSTSGSGPGSRPTFLPPELHRLMQSQPSAPFAPDGPVVQNSNPREDMYHLENAEGMSNDHPGNSIKPPSHGHAYVDMSQNGAPTGNMIRFASPGSG